MTEKRGQNADALGWAAAIAFAVVIAWQRVIEPDAYWNLAGGRLVLKGAIPAVNTFSHTFPDYQWNYTSWLYGALTALAESAFGDFGLTLLSIATAVCFSALLTKTARISESFRWRFHLPVLFLAIAAIQFRFQPRGDNATILGLAAIPLLWAKRNRFTPLWTFVLAAVWTNMHSGVVYGLIVWGVYLLISAIKRDKAALRIAASSLAAFIAGSFLNPTGAYTYFADVAGDYTFFAGIVSELGAVSFESTPLIIFFWIIGGAAVVEALLNREYEFAILFTGFIFSAFFGVRFSVFSVAVGVPGIGVNLRRLLGRITRPALTNALICLLIAAAAWCAWLESRRYLKLEDFGTGANPRHFPVAASSFIEKAGIPGDFFNEFDYGGYLIGRFYPERRMYIDGRMLAYPKDFYKRTMIHPSVSLAGQMQDYPLAHIALVQRRGDGEHYEFAFDALGWKTVFSDQAATVFVRPGTPAEKAGEKYELKIIKLWQPETELFQNVSFNRAQALAELKTMRLREFFLPHDFYALAHSSLLAGDPALAEEFYQRGIERQPGSKRLKEEYERFKGR